MHGNTLTKQEDIFQEAVHFFLEAFRASQNVPPQAEDLLDVIPQCVSNL